ncbi:hypothetical protein ZWY2020_015714 [Hordeum vulgare]|nr:hypothetical protein ZWY2020_015714 [Hordeum vulgare]
MGQVPKLELQTGYMAQPGSRRPDDAREDCQKEGKSAVVYGADRADVQSDSILVVGQEGVLPVADRADAQSESFSVVGQEIQQVDTKSSTSQTASRWPDETRQHCQEVSCNAVQHVEAKFDTNSLRGEEMADFSDNPSSSHGQAVSTIEALEHREVLGIPDERGKLVEEFEAEYLEMRMKIHRVPASLADMGDQFGDQFVIPIAVAIGPYHHGLPRLQGMEKVNRVAAHTLSRDSGKSREDMYALVLAADKARRLYGEDVVSGISKDEFAGRESAVYEIVFTRR